MQQRSLLAAGGAAILLAACSGGGSADRLQAGQWEMKTKLTTAEAPGATPQMLAQMRAGLNREEVRRNCISEAQAASPIDQFRAMMTRNQGTANCTDDEATFTGGTIRVRITCRAAGGPPGEAVLRVEGSFTDTTLQATMSYEARGAGTGGMADSVRMTNALSGNRIGACQPAAPATPGNTL